MWFGVVHIASVSLSVKWRIFLPPKAISGNHKYKPFSTACSSQQELGACMCICGPPPPWSHGARLTLLIKAYQDLTVSPSNTRGRMHFLKKCFSSLPLPRCHSVDLRFVPKASIDTHSSLSRSEIIGRLIAFLGTLFWVTSIWTTVNTFVPAGVWLRGTAKRILVSLPPSEHCFLSCLFWEMGRSGHLKPIVCVNRSDQRS